MRHANALTHALRATIGTLALCASMAALAKAEIVILNANQPGVGFNDPTPVAPVGGNNGKTLGEQRQIAFQYVADLWGKELSSKPKVNVIAAFIPLPCTTFGAVLGAAGANTIWRDFNGAKFAGTWYPAALANKLAGEDLLPDTDDAPEIFAIFNSELGKPGCFEGSPFYLGWDGKPGPATDLIPVVLHEFGHGLGFQGFTDEETGEQIDGFPSVWDYFLYDTSQFRRWVDMSNAQRVASAVNPRGLAWIGSHVRSGAPRVLDRGTPQLFVAGGSATGFYLTGASDFGPQPPTSGVIAPVRAISTNGCAPLSTADAANAKGNIALIDRGGCFFTDKVQNAQAAGARAVLIADNVPGSPPQELGGADPAVNIPSVRITQADGAKIKAQLVTSGFVFGALSTNQALLRGATFGNAVLMYTPSTLQLGSSVSHWDTSARRNLLMEPNLTDDLTQSVKPPEDLTLQLLKDIGW